MGAFLENSLFFFVDDSEPILPIFRSPEYGDPGRIVEVTDVGCDTETIYPVHLSRGPFHRGRGGAESYGSIRKIAEWRNKRPDKFSRTIATVLSNKDRNGQNYIGDKARQIERDYDAHDVYIANLDYDSCAENFYDDYEMSKIDDSTTEYKDYYAQFVVDPRNTIRHSNRKKLLRERYNFTRDPESSFARNNQRENISPRQWFTESNERNFREAADFRSRRSSSNEQKKQAKIFSRINKNFNREMEFGKIRDIEKSRQRNDFIIDSRNNFWDAISLENDSISLENETNCEELTFTNPKKSKNRDLQPKISSNNFVDSEREKEFEENDRKNLSPRISTGSAKYQTSKSNFVKEKPKILQSNTLNANFPRVKSTRSSKIIDERVSNVNSAEKDSTNVKSRLTFEEKKIGVDFPFEKKTETVHATFARTTNHRQHRVNKLSNETRHQSARTFKRIANSNSNEEICDEQIGTNEEANSRSRNLSNNKIDRINGLAVSRSAVEEKNERTFTSRCMTGASGVEREKRKFLSRLPIRTWKRLRTKEPAALRTLESDITNGDDNRKRQSVKIETTNLNDHVKKIKHDEVGAEKIRTVHAIADRSDIKRSNRFNIELSDSVDKSKITSSNVKNIRGFKDLSTKKGTSEQQKKKMNIK